MEHGQLVEGRGAVRGGRLSGLLEEVLAAHGGRDRWAAGRQVSAHAQSGGFALRSKLAARPFREYDVTVSVHEPRATIDPYPAAGRRGVFGGDRVWIEDAESGETVAERSDPRSGFPYGRRALWWDRLDALYFAGYALWNYLTLPALLAREDVEVAEAQGRRLEVSFPAGLPTHSREQAFLFDSAARLVRHDYTAEVFGGWAKAAHVSSGHQDFDGVPFATSRRVTPRRRNGYPARFPVLVWIEFDSFRLG